MIDTLPTRRSAIFMDTKTRKLPHSFYWGVAVAALFHAGIVYYLVQQNFNLAAPPETAVVDNPVIVTVDKPQPKPQTPVQKPVTHIMVHASPDPLLKTDVLPLTPQPKTDDGPKTPTLTLDPKPDPGPAVTKADPGPVYVTPRWKAFPDAETLTNYYPPRALDNEVEGSASVQCTVVDSAGHVRCTVVSETPKGYGFGQQTAKMVEEKGRVDTAAGDIRVGSVLATTTVKWQLN